ncbi:MAG: hypothetical protein KC983_01445 [Phycisphaerales bacterium]|nr:hypothetical protein [Phycisphaerales bacterium]
MSTGISILSSLPTLLLFFVTLCALWIVMRARRKTSDSAAACARCGYSVDFSNAICSECGDDLRFTGTPTRRITRRWRSSPFTIILLWTVLVLAFVAGPVMLALASAGKTNVLQMHYSYRWTAQSGWGRIATGAPHVPYSVSMSLNTINGRISDWTMDLRTLDAFARHVSVTLDPDTREWTLIGPGEPMHGSGFESDSVRRMLIAAGVDAEHWIHNRSVDAMSYLLTTFPKNPANTGINFGYFADANEFVQSLDFVNSTENPDGTMSYTFEPRSFLPNDTDFELIVNLDEQREPRTSRPLALTSLNVSIGTRTFLPIVFTRNMTDDTWTAPRNGEPIEITARETGDLIPTTGPIPPDPDAMHAILDRYSDAIEPLNPPEGTADDIARILALRDEDLIAFTGWMPIGGGPKARGIGLQSMGSSSSGHRLGLHEVIGIPMFTLLVVAVIAIYVIGLITLLRKYNRAAVT